MEKPTSLSYAELAMVVEEILTNMDEEALYLDFEEIYNERHSNEGTKP